MIRQKRVISNLLFNMDKTNVIITFKNPNWTVSWPYLTSFQNFFWPLLIFFVFLFMLFGANFEFFIRQPNDSKLNAMPSLKTSLWTQRPIWDPSNLSTRTAVKSSLKIKKVFSQKLYNIPLSHLSCLYRLYSWLSMSHNLWVIDYLWITKRPIWTATVTFLITVLFYSRIPKNGTISKIEQQYLIY